MTTPLRSALVLIVGAVVLAPSVRVESESVAFYLCTAGLIVTWVAGAWWVRDGIRMLPQATDAVAPMRADARWGVVPTTVATASVIAVGFLFGGLVAAQIPVLDAQIDELVGRTGYTVAPALILTAAVTGIAEEVFFRGALYSALSRHPVVVSTAMYTAVTAVTGNLGLVIAAAVLGAITATSRQISGSVIPAIVGHLAWTATTVGLLPLLLTPLT